jgi:hypothetical protein
LTIARLLWRKANLGTFETAQLVKFRYREIFQEELKSREIRSSHSQMFVEKCEDQPAPEEAWRAAQKQANAEFGDRCEFTHDDFGTRRRLMMDLDLEERLDAGIDKCLKRLLMVRGVKSVALARRQSRRNKAPVNRPAA